MSSDNHFKLVGQNGKNMKTINTQLVLLECLTDEILNPLLQKFESQQIVKDIYNMRKDHKNIQTHYDISANIVMKNKYNKPSLYINYYKYNTKEKVFHLSLHVCPSTTNSRQSFLHFKQNNITRKNIPKRSIRINRNNNNSIVFSLNSPEKGGKNISPELIEEAKVVIKVLNSYFNKKLPSFIQNKNKTLKRSTGFKRIKTEMNKSYENYTRKQRIPQY
jgi:hypothetical protein